jgi:hypothetical protein
MTEEFNMKRFVAVFLFCLNIIPALYAQSENVFYEEDFSSYEPGDPLPSWGKNVIAFEGNDKLTYITSQVPGEHVVEQKIRFTPNFSLEFSWANPQANAYLVLLDDTGEGVKISFRYHYGHGNHQIHAKFENTVEKHAFKRDRSANRVYRLKVLRKNDTFKLFVDDSFLLSSTLPDMGNLVGLKMVVPQGQYFTDFKGTKIVLPD